MVKRLFVLGKEAGFSGLFAGLGPRISEHLLCDCVASSCADRLSHDCRACGLSTYNVRLHQVGTWSLEWYRDPQGRGRDCQIEIEHPMYHVEHYTAGDLCGNADYGNLLRKS